MRTTIGVLVMSLMALPSLASERKIDWTSTAVLVSGQAFDIISTQQAIQRGCVEGNPLFRTQTPSVGRLVAAKTLFVVAPTITASMLLQKHGHPRIAKVFSYGGGAVGYSVGAMNFANECGGRK